MDIAVHIGQLVLKHECVIVPGLGAFLTNYHAAEINLVQHSIQPPIRKLVFNAQLNSNDGLLAHYLSIEMNISYKIATQLLEVFADYCQRDLEQGKQIAFGEMGILDMNIHHKLEFYPNRVINYNEDAFGLKPLVLKAIDHKSDFSLNAPIRKTNKKAGPAKVIAINRTLRKMAAVLIPLALFIGAVLYLPPFVQNKEVNQSSIVSFFDNLKSSAFSFVKNADTSEEIKAKESVEAPILESIVENTSADLAEVKKETEIIANPSSDVVEQNTDVFKGNYHIICGSFVERERAEALVNHLNTKGFDACIAGQSRSGNYRVSIQSFINAGDASRQIKFIRQQGYDMAWILDKSF